MNVKFDFASELQEVGYSPFVTDLEMSGQKTVEVA